MSDHIETFVEQGRKVGEGIYPSLSEDDQAVIAFGMSPKWLMDEIEKKSREKLALIEAKRIGVPVEEMDVLLWARSIRPQVINSILHGAHLGLLGASKKAGKMRV